MQNYRFHNLITTKQYLNRISQQKLNNSKKWMEIKMNFLLDKKYKEINKFKKKCLINLKVIIKQIEVKRKINYWKVILHNKKFFKIKLLFQKSKMNLYFRFNKSIIIRN